MSPGVAYPAYEAGAYRDHEYREHHEHDEKQRYSYRGAHSFEETSDEYSESPEPPELAPCRVSLEVDCVSVTVCDGRDWSGHDVSPP